ncbi:MAG: hypothetical protein NUW07_11290, partial [Candidatus Saccharicenans sp.]|nr:hypothetical protein [Candidatus Saccharicenans sp.]
MYPAKKNRIKTPAGLRSHLAALSAILTFLALLSAVWLDRLNFQQQKVYYLPWRSPSQSLTASLTPAPFSLSEFLRQHLSQLGLSPEAITEEKT